MQAICDAGMGVRLRRFLSAWILNGYSLACLSFAIWMVFFDAEDLLTQRSMQRKLKLLKAEKAHFSTQITQIKSAQKALTSRDDLLEKFAREKYFMRKPEEEIYVVANNAP